MRDNAVITREESAKFLRWAKAIRQAKRRRSAEIIERLVGELERARNGASTP